MISQKSPSVRQSSRKRVYDQRPSSQQSESSQDTPKRREDQFGSVVIWTTNDLEKLTNLLRKEGFHGDYAETYKHFPHLTERSIRTLFAQLSRPTQPANNIVTGLSTKHAKKVDSSKEDNIAAPQVVSPAPIEKWMGLLLDHNETQRLGTNLSNILDYIAKFEEHPDPSTCGGVDYAAIYSYMGALSKGHIPKQLNSASAKKLLQMLQVLKRSILKSAPNSQQVLLQHAKRPFHNPRTEGEEKNRILRERRRATWSEDELKEADFLKTGGLQTIKKHLCDKPGLNPFHLPPTL